MDIEIGNVFDITLCGLQKPHEAGKAYGAEIVALLDRVWPVLRAKGVRQKGINIAVYDADGTVFAGVELLEPDADIGDLAVRWVHLERTVSFRHVGPYRLLGQAHQRIRDEMAKRGWAAVSPNVEIYGHWNDDESKLETEIIYGFGAVPPEWACGLRHDR